MKSKLAVLILLPLVLAGCSSHQTPTASAASAPKMASPRISTQQASENALKHALSGGPLTSHAPSLAAYSLKGY